MNLLSFSVVWWKVDKMIAMNNLRKTMPTKTVKEKKYKVAKKGVPQPTG